MRRVGVWGIGAAVAVALCQGAPPASAQDGPDGRPGGTTGLRRFFQKSPDALDVPKPVPKADKKTAKDKKDLKAGKETLTPTPAVDTKPDAKINQAVVERKREEVAFFRRSEVCLKLMEVAQENNDDELYRLAEELEERARAVYSQRTAHLPASNAAFVSDEQTLEKYLGAPPTDAGRPRDGQPYTVTGENAGARTAVREVKP